MIFRSTTFHYVPLGVLPYTETKYEDMMQALEDIQKYVPFKHVVLPKGVTRLWLSLSWLPPKSFG